MLHMEVPRQAGRSMKFNQGKDKILHQGREDFATELAVRETLGKWSDRELSSVPW